MKWLKKVAATPLTSIARVVDSLQNQTNDRTNAPSINAVNEAITNIWATIYPVGSIYITTDTVDPATRFGGTWTQLKQKFLIAADDENVSYANGAEGGAFSRNYTPSGSVGGHTLTAAEIPSHKHGGIISGYSTVRGSLGDTGIESNFVCDPITGQTDAAGSGGSHNHGFTGSQATINTTPPYLAVYMWKRIA